MLITNYQHLSPPLSSPFNWCKQPWHQIACLIFPWICNPYAQSLTNSECQNSKQINLILSWKMKWCRRIINRIKNRSSNSGGRDQSTWFDLIIWIWNNAWSRLRCSRWLRCETVNNAPVRYAFIYSSEELGIHHNTFIPLTNSLMSGRRICFASRKT